MTSATSATSPTILCITCGYDLRGRGGSDLCPECGRSVAATLAARPLGQADPRWLRRIASGARLLGFAAAVLPLAMIDELIDPYYAAVQGLAAVALLAFGILSALGGWRLATRDPAAPRRDGAIARGALRAVAVVAVPCALMGAAHVAISVCIQSTKITFPGNVHRLIVAGWEWTVASLPIVVWLAFARLAAVLRRTHAPVLRRSALVAGIAFALPMVHLFATMILFNHDALGPAAYKYIDASAKPVALALVAGCALGAVVSFITAARLSRLARPTIAP